jgi:formylglycine-generating enzyme required for sulfatase activity
MVLVPAGRFLMGSEQGEPDESPRHEVSLSGFAIDKFEVTQDLLARLQQPNPSHFKAGRRPVEQVRWSDAALLCNERSRAEGLDPCYDEVTFACDFEANGYRLPTEAEWEYAARAGDDADVGGRADPRQLERQACFADSSRGMTEIVGSRRANAWGLHDLQGNVAEWCQDRYDEAYYATSPSRDPRGPGQGPLRVLRGGSWKSARRDCRVTARAADNPGISDACFAQDSYGFRCARRLTGQEVTLLVGAGRDRGLVQTADRR